MQLAELAAATNRVDRQLAVVVTALLSRMAGRTLNPREVALLTQAILPAVTRARGLHYELSAEFYRDLRARLLGTADDFTIPAQRTYPRDALAEGILATTRNRQPGQPAFDRAVTGAAIRHAGAAGIDVIKDAAAADPAATGWARVHTGLKPPCAFCAMLISRGPVYSRDGAGFAAHNGCSCRPSPVFRGHGFDGDEQYRRYRDRWREATGGHGGRDALNRFRRAMAEQ